MKHRRLASLIMACREWLIASRGMVERASARDEKCIAYLNDGDLNKAMVLRQTPYFHVQEILRSVDRDHGFSLNPTVSWIWRMYMLQLHASSDEVGMPVSVERMDSEFSAVDLFAAYILGQEGMLSGMARIYSAFEELDSLHAFASAKDGRCAEWASLDIYLLLNKTGIPVPECMSEYSMDAEYLDENLDAYGRLLFASGEEVKSLLSDLCEEHVMACSRKNREDVFWGLFPVRLLAYMKMAGLDPRKYSDAHPLLALPTCQIDLWGKYELQDEVVIRIRDAASLSLKNGLMPLIE